MTHLQLEKLVKNKKFIGSFLFCGPNEETELAAIDFAKKIFSNNPKVEAGNHPDVHLYRPEGKSATHSIDSIRSLTEQVYLAPFEAPWKIFIIHDAERMLPTSSNALLKTFEEPAKDTILILLSSASEQILPTIVSRCRKLFFYSNAQTLKIREDLQKPLLEFLSLSQKNYLNIRDFSIAFAELFEDNKSEFEEVCNLILSWFRDLHLLLCGGDTQWLMHPDHYETLLHQTQKGNTPSLELVQKSVANARASAARYLPISSILESLFLKLT